MNHSFAQCLRRIATAVICGPLAVTCVLSQVYRTVDSNGRVTFSERPLPQASALVRVPGQTGMGAISNASTATSGAAAAPAAGTGTLPPALQLIVSRYPVTLLTSKDCAKCGQGRSLLTTRGIPFIESLVTTAADMEQLQNQIGKFTLPVLTVGSLPVKDLAAPEWNGFLDAAGYPKSSALPLNYKNPMPTPWVPPRVARAEAAISAPPPPIDAVDPAPRLVALPPSDNPSGLKF